MKLTYRSLLATMLAVSATPAHAYFVSINGSIPGVELIRVAKNSSSLSNTNRGFAGAISPSGLIYSVGGVALPNSRSSEDTAALRFLSSGLADTSWASGGAAVNALENDTDRAKACLLQPDGKLVASGVASVTKGNKTQQFASIVRYNTDGTLDTSFAGDGAVEGSPNSFSSTSNSMGRLSDGSIVIGGYNVGSHQNWLLGKFSSSGSPIYWVIKSFALNSMINSMAIDSLNRIVVAGEAGVSDSDSTVTRYNLVSSPGNTDTDLTVARYSASGSPDPSFGGTGIVAINLGDYEHTGAVLVQSDGKVVVAGSSVMGQDTWTMARLNDDGSLDSGFGSGGIVVLSGSAGIIRSIAQQADGKIVATGDTFGQLGYARVNTDGSVDVPVQTTAVKDSAYPSGIQIQPDGKSVVFGYAIDQSAHLYYMMTARYNTDGTLDSSF